jgi:hypothetical protein
MPAPRTLREHDTVNTINKPFRDWAQCTIFERHNPDRSRLLGQLYWQHLKKSVVASEVQDRSWQ